MTDSQQEPEDLAIAEFNEMPPDEPLSEADASGRLDDVPGAQPELAEADLAPDDRQPGLSETDLASDDIPEDS